MMERQTAVKVRIKDLTGGRWTEMEGMEPSYVETEAGARVARARILGTIVTKFVSEDGNFASATIDDTTDTIRMKAFKTIKLVSELAIGDLVDAVGKAREYNEEVYIIPEVIRKVDPNTELLRKLELLKQAGAAQAAQPIGRKINAEESYNKDSIRKELLAVLIANPKGIMFSEILKAVKAPSEVTESVLNDMLSEGVCYEPSPGKIRKI
jgi:RPA family protein